MLRLEVGRLLELHERLTVEKGNFGRAQYELTRAGIGSVRWAADDLRKLLNDVSDVAGIASYAGIASTRKAAERTKTLLSRYPVDDPSFAGADFQLEAAGVMYRHLQDIVSRIRDDCESRIYFQIEPGREELLNPDMDHFGKEVREAFPETIEDIAEAASCLALERPTACVFHLMRALEAAAKVVADKVGATVTDEHGRGLPWGVIASNMKPKIDSMTKGSDEQIKWYKIHASLETMNRAYRTPTNHPNQTYTLEIARRVFETTRGFMQELASLA